MAMSFVQSCDVVLLFSWWHPTTLPEYTGSLMLIYGACLFQAWLHRRHSRRQAHAEPGGNDHSTPLVGWAATAASAAGWWPSVAVALEEAISIALGFALMLLLMTFNVGVFCTIVLGVLSGRHVFSCSHHRHGGTSKPPGMPQRHDSHASELCDM
jgi:hypothetical protein